jgi:NAD(P)H-dependent flavin oxidoreductase YrpB (nitropropane dioxygenase family)
MELQLPEPQNDRAAAPILIQGGMGVAVSGWRLARAVSQLGELGVVSGTALDAVLARRLQLGDPGGELRRAIEHFPNADAARRVLARYFVPGGVPDEAALDSPVMFTATPTTARQELAAIAGFVEVFLAKEGHTGLVGINFLHKIQLPTPATLYGALLAGVDYVLVGAGIPRDIPGLIERLCAHEPATIALHVSDAGEERYELRFDPADVLPRACPPLRRPRFLAIVASATLAQTLARRGDGAFGFVVEAPSAGGHNAPPRGPLTLNPDGEPLYGPRDAVDFSKMRALNLPFWLAGGCASPERLTWAREQGAAGVQVGSAFALCEESGLDPSLRSRLRADVAAGRARVFTDPKASPTGFPFKVAGLAGTLSEASVYEARARRCDLGYLRELYRRPDGALGYRCPAEPVEDYVRKGGRVEDTAGRKCICNGLVSNIGLGQRRDGYDEPPIVTAGSDFEGMASLFAHARTAADVVSYVLAGTPAR